MDTMDKECKKPMEFAFFNREPPTPEHQRIAASYGIKLTHVGHRSPFMVNKSVILGILMESSSVTRRRHCD